MGTATLEIERPGFESGSKLPTTTELIELLNQLYCAKQLGDEKQGAELEAAILSLAKPGIYEGYVKDDDPYPSVVRLVSIRRKGAGANIYSFGVELQVLEGDEVRETCELDLFEFLREWCRVIAFERSHIGPRFLPL